MESIVENLILNRLKTRVFTPLVRLEMMYRVFYQFCSNCTRTGKYIFVSFSFRFIELLEFLKLIVLLHNVKRNNLFFYTI